MAYKPDSYPDLSPYLIVEDPEQVLAFAERAFDGTRLRVHHRGDGSIMHGEVRVGDSVVMVGGASGVAAPHLHLYCPDPDAWFAAALAAGGTEVQPLSDNDDGDRRGGVQSPDGTTWWLSRQLSDPGR